jgi:hypothetical protein
VRGVGVALGAETTTQVNATRNAFGFYRLEHERSRERKTP